MVFVLFAVFLNPHIINELKKIIMRKFTFTLLAAITILFANAQSVNRVLILNEGYYDYVSSEIITPVTIGAYDPATSIYTTLDEIENARFATDIKIDGNYFYVAADDHLLKYDLLTNELINSVEITGIRKLAFWNDDIIVTRGEYLLTFDSYVQVYDKNSLEMIFEVPGDIVPHAAEGIVVKDGIAYVAVNNGFIWGEEVGYIAAVDLYTQTVISTIDLGPNGKNPDNIMMDGDNIFTLNNKDYTGSSVSNFKIGTGDIATTDLINISAGCGTSVYFNGDIYYQELFNSVVTKYNPITEVIVDETDYTKNFYAIAFDEINNLMYASETDYFSFGKINIYEIGGDLISSFDAGVSPGNIVLDVRMGTAVNEIKPAEIKIYPNPTVETLTIQMAGNSSIDLIEIYSVDGKKIEIQSTANSIDVSSLSAGTYFLKITSGDNVISKSFSKI